MEHFKKLTVPLGGEENVSFYYYGLEIGNKYVNNIRKIEEEYNSSKRDKQNIEIIKKLLKDTINEIKQTSKELSHLIIEEDIPFKLFTYLTRSDYRFKKQNRIYCIMDYLFKATVDNLKKESKSTKFNTLESLVLFENKLTESFGNFNTSFYDIPQKEDILILSDYVSLYKLATLSYLLKDNNIKNVSILSLEKVEI